MLEGRVARLRTLLGRASEPGGFYRVFHLATQKKLDAEERAAMHALIAESRYAAAFAEWIKPDRDLFAKEASKLEPQFSAVHMLLAELYDESLQPSNPSGLEINASDGPLPYLPDLIEKARTRFKKDNELVCLMRGSFLWAESPPLHSRSILEYSEWYEGILTHEADFIDASFFQVEDLPRFDCPELKPHLRPGKPYEPPPPPPPEPKGPIKKPVFRNVEELKTALLNSYPDHEYATGPFVLFYVGRETDADPGWKWTTELIRRRSDWWPVLGEALQRAAAEGGELARMALADLHQQFPTEAQVLLHWTEPLARQYPDALAKYNQVNRKLSTIIGEQIIKWDATNDGPAVITIYDGQDGNPVTTRIRTQAELESALSRCAKVGMPCPPEQGPWSWLVTESFAHPWLLPMLPVAFAKFAKEGTDNEVRAMLDFFMDRFDLWRYVELFESWLATPPSWANEPGKKRKPRGWTTPCRWGDHVEVLGTLPTSYLIWAREDVETKPVSD